MTRRRTLCYLVVFVLVLGGLAPLTSTMGPAIGGLALAVTVTIAELLGLVLGICAVLMWQEKL